MHEDILFAGTHIYHEMHLRPLAHRLGEISVTRNPIPATSIVCLDEASATFIANQNYTSCKLPFNKHKLHLLRDRIDQNILPISVIPSIIPKTKEDIEYYMSENSSVFIKRRKTIVKSDPLSYKYFTSIDDILKNLPEDFWFQQSNPHPEYGEYILQPYLGHPLKYVDVSVSISPNGTAWCHSYFNMVDIAPNKVDYMATTTAIPDIQSQVQAISDYLQLGPGLHCVQWVYYKNAWRLLDWNPRTGEPELHCLMGQTSFFDPALEHLLGRPITTQAPKFIECRGYWNTPLKLSDKSWLASTGLYPYIQYNTPNLIPRVFAVGDSIDEINYKFSVVDRARHTYN